MNRRGFIGLFAAMIAYPFIKIFGSSEIKYIPPVNDIKENILYLERLWIAGALLGVHCDCKNKIVVERGQYSDPSAESVFRAWVEYCPKHGFTTDCWRCGDGTTTEICRRNHDKITAADLLVSAPKAYGITSDNFRPQLTSIKDIMRFSNV